MTEVRFVVQDDVYEQINAEQLHTALQKVSIL
jgi:hypothetical protein